MYACMYVCMYVCMKLCMWVDIHVHVHIYLCAYAHGYLVHVSIRYTCCILCFYFFIFEHYDTKVCRICSKINLWVWGCMYTCMGARMDGRMSEYVCKYVYILYLFFNIIIIGFDSHYQRLDQSRRRACRCRGALVGAYCDSSIPPIYQQMNRSRAEAWTVATRALPVQAYRCSCRRELRLCQRVSLYYKFLDFFTSCDGDGTGTLGYTCCRRRKTLCVVKCTSWCSLF
jgi:hypothetical protein